MMGLAQYFQNRKQIKVELEEKYLLCRQICERSFEGVFRGVEFYLGSNDFLMMDIQKRVLEMTCAKVDENIKEEMKNRLSQIMDHRAELDKEAAELEKVRIALIDEIIKFTQVVKELGERYKLSPNWEGKKPILIEKQKELEGRKQEYEEKEKEINKKFRALYREYTQLDIEIRTWCQRYLGE